MIEHKLERVEPGDPNQCQSSGMNGQCPYKAIANAKYCQRHGGNKSLQVLADASLRNYRLSKWQDRIDQLADSSKVKSLREDIGILRMMLEETINKCNDEVELVMNSAKIADLVLKIEKLVTSCHRLESNLGLMLDKQAAMQLSGEIVNIIGKHVTDDSTIAAIANDIGAALARTASAIKED